MTEFMSRILPEHNDWLKCHNNWNKKKYGKPGDKSSTNSLNSSGLKLKLRENTKKVLTTTHRFSEADPFRMQKTRGGTKYRAF